MEVGLGPGDNVLDGDRAPPQRKGTQHPSPHFSAHFALARSPISEILSSCILSYTGSHAVRARRLSGWLQLVAVGPRLRRRNHALHQVSSVVFSQTSALSHQFLALRDIRAKYFTVSSVRELFESVNSHNILLSLSMKPIFITSCNVFYFNFM